MSNFNDVELKNQNLRQTTTMDSSAFANLPGEELSEQDLDAVSGGKTVFEAYSPNPLLYWKKMLEGAKPTQGMQKRGKKRDTRSSYLAECRQHLQ